MKANLRKGWIPRGAVAGVSDISWRGMEQIKTRAGVRVASYSLPAAHWAPLVSVSRKTLSWNVSLECP